MRIDSLTIRRIAQGKLKAQVRSLHDGGGLYVRPRDGGGSWMFKYQTGGALHTKGLGSVAQVGAPEAREMARQFRSGLTRGSDPLHERRQERRKQRTEQRAWSTTFKQVAEQVLTAYEASTRNATTRRSWHQRGRGQATGEAGL